MEHKDYGQQTGLDVFIKKACQVKRILPSLFNIKVLGERGSESKSNDSFQDFNKLRQQCLDEGQLFEDPEFPAVDSSLYFSCKPDKNIEWKRPTDIVENPQLFVKAFSRFDIKQGELGDCWLLAALANVTQYPHLFSQIVPDDQSFETNYAGIFHFRFWQYGNWVDVVVDDRLPTYNGNLLFLHSSDENEFWSALLEKAYAKLHGSYESLIGGWFCEAMEDFTGGIPEMYEIDQAPSDLFSIMLKAYERNSLMGCSIDADPCILEAKTPQGLIRGHAYSITRVKYVDIQTLNRDGKIPMIRIRNPWGDEAEWNGSWSDCSPEWVLIPNHEREKLGLTFDDDGEFWMSFQDFKKYFTKLEICYLNPNSLAEDNSSTEKKQWETSVFEGEWVRGVTAGGCQNYLDTFWCNPQYRIILECPDENDDMCTVIISLMQKNRRAQRKTGADCLTIGFAVYHLEDSERLPKPLDIDFFKYNVSVARSSSFCDLREVSCHVRLPPGVYCIIPSTFDPNEEGEFIIRLFSENKNYMEENDEDVGIGETDDRVSLQFKDQTTRDEDEKVVEVQPTLVRVNEEKAREYFNKIAGDDMEIDWKELKQILDYVLREEIHNQGFSEGICRKMIATSDRDQTDKLNFEEFKMLWNDIKKWRAIFKLYDRDNSDNLNAFELRHALNSAGYRLNYRVLNDLVRKYGTEEGTISFHDFIVCVVKLKTMIGKDLNTEKKYV